MHYKIKKHSHLITITGILVAICFLYSCSKGQVSQGPPVNTSPYPASDPSNTGNWKLNNDISDEFEGSNIDASKWFIQGTNGVYQSNFIGRAPAQFSTANVRIENGKLKLQTKWEPGFNFSPTPDNSGTKYENITTAAVISKKQFLYGYMEIKCKAADASITSTFWTTGNNSELDVFEFLGWPAQVQKKYLENEYRFSIHDWSPGQGGARVWSDTSQLNWRVADSFHIYGCEWDKDYLKFFADGKLVKTATRLQLGSAWVLTNPLWIWVSSTTWTWDGLPVQQDLPVDYEIEYIRVWQHK